MQGYHARLYRPIAKVDQLGDWINALLKGNVARVLEIMADLGGARRGDEGYFLAR